MPNIIEINDFNAPELDIFARLKENQLQHYYEPNPGLFIECRIFSKFYTCRKE